MSQDKQRLEILLYAPHQSITPSMLEAFLSAIPSLVPTPPLDHEVNELGELRKVAEPGQWLYEQELASEVAMLCNTDEQIAVTASLLFLPPLQGPPGAIEGAQLKVRMPVLARFTEPMVPLMRALGSISNAFWGDAASDDAIGYIVRNFQVPRPLGAPPAAPSSFGWVNYWSQETCRLLDFDISGPKRRLFADVLPCENGAVVLKLTHEPLDLQRPEHMAALVAAYEAFPAIPRQKRAQAPA